MIRVEKIKKIFRQIVAVDDVSFEVERGEILGFIGPNGAGKTTTMKIIACLARPDSGRVTVGGFDVVKNAIEVRRLIGYLPENTPLYGDMTVSSFLNFVCDVRRIERKKIAREIERVADICALSDVYHRSIDTLSKGYRKRVGLAQVLIGDPPVLLLDEPTDGLDPNQKRYVRSLIKSMSKNKAIVVSTHILEELEAICNRAIIINEGKIAADSTPDDFRERGKGSIDVFFENITEGRR